MNKLKTVFLLGLLSGLIMLVGGFIGGKSGMIFALIISFVMNFGAYWWSDKIVLSTYKAKEVSQIDYPELYKIVQDLSMRIPISMPKIYIMEMESPNAFATGRNEKHAVVAVSSGLLNILDKEELRGVISHELAHIKNNDMLIASIAASIAGAISYITQMAYFSSIFGGSDDENGSLVGSIAMLILAPIIATILHMAISRSREYIADENGAKYSGNPRGLASALNKLNTFTTTHELNGTQKEKTMASLFIINPFKISGLMSLFSTHPPIEERIMRLNNLKIT